MTDLQVLVSDGNTEKRILWLRASPNGVYFGINKDGKGRHYSYHRDGRLWETQPVKRQVRIGQPFGGFREYELLMAWGISSTLVDVVELGPRRSTKRVILDITEIIKQRLNLRCTLYLVGSGRNDLVSSLAEPMQPASFTLMTETDPWILAIVSGSKSLRTGTVTITVSNK